MPYNFIKSVINETIQSRKLEQLSLPYKKNELDPVMSEDTLNYHYGKLYKAYVDRFNESEGDPEFNEAGAFLHHILFEQFKEPNSANSPSGPVLELIESKFKTWDNFKEQFNKVAMGIQGSGWVYLSYKGEIKTIVNHKIHKDILLLIDWWEHAWALDYQHDKKKYLNNIWRIIDWSVINIRYMPNS